MTSRNTTESSRHATRILLGVITTIWILFPVPRIHAHHSFAMFDTGKTITLAGTVTEFQWTNPHAYIELDVPQDDGTIRHWTIELGSPSILMQSGWKFNDIKPGDSVSATLNPLRDGQPGGLLGRVTLPDGRELPNGPGR